MKPIISYYGGKQRIASKIVEVLPPHTVYAEPFAGGCAVLFEKGLPRMTNSYDYLEVINDHDERLITLYRVLQSEPEAFLHRVEYTLYSQAEYQRSTAILRNPDEHSDMDRAWAYYVNISMGFANKLFGGWATSDISRNQAATWSKANQRLPELIERFRNVHIGCEDAIRFIQRWDSPHTCFYVDPPYPGTDLGHYIGGYTLKDWQALCDTLDSAQGSYVLSNYPQEIEPQSAKDLIEIRVASSASGQGQVGRTDKSRFYSDEELGDRQRTEVLWVCDRSRNARSDLQKVLRGQQTRLAQVDLFEAT